jgi:hypothetical protein
VLAPVCAHRLLHLMMPSWRGRSAVAFYFMLLSILPGVV